MTKTKSSRTSPNFFHAQESDAQEDSRELSQEIFDSAFDEHVVDASRAPSKTNSREPYSEKHARHLLSVLERASQARLADKTRPLDKEDAETLKSALQTLRPKFTELSSTIEPTRLKAPNQFSGAFEAIRHLMETCLDIGPILRISPTARQFLRKPLVEGARKGGEASGRIRRAKSEETWKREVRMWAEIVRRDQPTLSQARLAEEVADKGWAGNAPRQEAIVSVIREMERAGHLPPMKRK